MSKVNNKDTRPEQRQWRRSRVFIVNFDHISHLVLLEEKNDKQAGVLLLYMKKN